MYQVVLKLKIDLRSYLIFQRGFPDWLRSRMTAGWVYLITHVELKPQEISLFGSLRRRNSTGDSANIFSLAYFLAIRQVAMVTEKLFNATHPGYTLLHVDNQ